MLRTSEISFISSVHGRERRSERDITVRDLQAAVKYGVKERGFPDRLGAPRWKYTHGDVVYITDITSTKEITSWATELPLSSVEIPDRYTASLLEAQSRILSRPSIITSHTVLVVDMSGSMNKSDMNGHRTRARGVYYNLAMEFVATRLHPISSPLLGGPSITFTDVVSLIEMRGAQRVVFERQPVSWLLFNAFVALAESKDAHDHGNYYPSLKAAFKLLMDSSANAALAFFFFSDGQPSDFATASGLSREEVLEKIYDEVRSSCSSLSKRLTFTAFGFGKSETEFSIMKAIVDHACAVGAVATFGYTYSDNSALSNILASTSASTTEMRTLLSCLDTGSGERKLKSGIEKAIYNPWTAFNPSDWTYFNTCRTKSTFAKKHKLEYVLNKKTHKFVAKLIEAPMLSDSAGIAVGKKYFGEGAERIVFLMSEIDWSGEFIGPSLVAKESKHDQKEQSSESMRKWHQTFMKTQRRAEILATKFNAALDNKHISKNTPRIQFLPCHIYECQTDDADGQKEFSYLSENQLNPLYYKKWNNNNGGVDGQIEINKINYEGYMDPVPHLKQHNAAIQTVKKDNLDCIEEEEEDDDEENYDGHVDSQLVRNDINMNTSTFQASPEVMELESRILECDVPQAFTHFTHVITKREEMVCDIQGVLNIIDGHPIFQLTDPCIHSSGNRHKFGRTDKGSQGFGDFHKTHQCNCVCKLLGFANKSYR